jgi:carboxylesterase
MTHAEALARVCEIRDQEKAVNPVCHYRLFDHGRRTERAIVLLHGFTNCPKMYDQLATQLYESGANVVVPRLPRHGLADRLTTDLTRLSADDLKATAKEAVEIANGLGDTVTVAGLSLGGVLVGWLAQFGDGVDRAVLISPLFCAPVIPEWLSDLLGFVADRMPNVFVWWDSKSKADIAGPKHAYPRFPTHAYGQMLRLGYEVKKAARRLPPKCPEIRVVMNLADPAVNNVATRRLISNWRRGAFVRAFEFSREQGLAHDIISPDQTYARTAEVYPVLIEQITRDLVFGE